MSISRRQFLHQSIFGATAAAALANPSTSKAATKPLGFAGIKGVHLAIATICTDGFSNHHHEPAFRLIPQMDFQNVEFNLWYPDLHTPAYIRSIRDRCYQSGLTPVSLQATSFGGEGRTGVTKDLSHKLIVMDAIRQLGGRVAKFTGSRRGTNGGLKHVIDVCRELAPVAEEKGVMVVLENHANNVLENIADYEEIFSVIDSPNIGMCLDTGHFEGVSVDLHEVIDTFHERILHVDLKDCKERGKGHDTVPFGTGVTDFDAFLSHLMEKDYQGYLVIEQAWNEPRFDWENNLKKSYEIFKRWES